MSYPTPHPTYILAPAPDAGTCFGCLLFYRQYPPADCSGSGCQPSENPDGTGDAARGYRVVVAIKSEPAAAPIDIANTLQAGVRITDPATCFIAAAVVPVFTLRQAIVTALATERSLTGKEIAALTGKPLNSITPRFKGLVDSGVIRDAGFIRDGQTVWELV